MIKLLQTGKKYSIKELAEKLEVSERMVRKYKDDLEMAGIYIDSIKGIYGGYVLNEKLSKISIGLSKYDVDLLESIEKRLEKDKEFEMKKELIDLVNKIADSYNERKSKEYSIPYIRDDLDKQYMKEEKKKYNDFNRAIKEHNKVFVKFISVNSKVSERVIHPCEMFAYNDYWYVAAFCEKRAEIRHFRLMRIVEYRVLNEKYEKTLINR
jgi:predicted DNA-binding transcriptional regulator YafY